VGSVTCSILAANLVPTEINGNWKPVHLTLFYLSTILSRLDGEPEPSLALVGPLDDGGGGSGGVIFQNAEHPCQEEQLVDWATLQIVEGQDEEEGRLELIDEDQVYVLLGLRDEDDKAERAAKEAIAGAGADGDKGKAHAVEDTHGAAIPVDDDIPGERRILYDPNKPTLDLGTVYPSMEAFRFAVRQYAINEEYELKIVKTCPKKYVADCRDEGCPWHLIGNRQPDGKTIMVFICLLKCALSKYA
jgi:hypothetical protein